MAIERENLDTNEKSLLEQTEREKILVRLYQNGTNTSDCIAYHGTSLETIQFLITKGFIPGYTAFINNNPELPQHGDIYFMPRLGVFPFDKLPSLPNPSESKNKKYYPKKVEELFPPDDIAKAHRFCSLLSLNIAEYGYDAMFYMDDYNGARTLDGKDAEKRLKLLFTDEQLAFAEKMAKKRKGVILGLKKDALEKYSLSQGDLGSDIRLNGGLNGFPIDIFSGIKPSGKEEKAFLDALKARHS